MRHMPSWLQDKVTRAKKDYIDVVTSARSMCDLANLVDECREVFTTDFERIEIFTVPSIKKIEMTFHTDEISLMTPVLRWFAERTLRQEKGRAPRDVPTSQQRKWFLVENVTIIAQLPVDPAAAGTEVCRYVRTGTRMVEQPVYELKCGPAE